MDRIEIETFKRDTKIKTEISQILNNNLGGYTHKDGHTVGRTDRKADLISLFLLFQIWKVGYKQTNKNI
jgi:hypothetical protein